MFLQCAISLGGGGKIFLRVEIQGGGATCLIGVSCGVGWLW